MGEQLVDAGNHDAEQIYDQEYFCIPIVNRNSIRNSCTLIYQWIIYRYLLCCVLLLCVSDNMITYLRSILYLYIMHGGTVIVNAGNHINILYCTYKLGGKCY